MAAVAKFPLIRRPGWATQEVMPSRASFGKPRPLPWMRRRAITLFDGGLGKIAAGGNRNRQSWGARR